MGEDMLSFLKEIWEEEGEIEGRQKLEQTQKKNNFNTENTF